MAKFNVAAARAVGTGPIATDLTPSLTTHEGFLGYARDPKSELFLLAVSNFVGEATFYEKADARDNRYTQLIRHVAVADPDWTAGFLHWLRSDANMRSASLVGALEAAKAMLDAKQPGARPIVASVLQRADEPGEALAYWTATYGRAVPKPVKRGIADAVARLYTERCVTPDTLVLTRDLSWVRAGELQVGDELVAFDEQVRSAVRGQAAKMRVAVVTATRTAMLPTVRVRTDKGETSVSVDHQFVVSTQTRNRQWRRAGDLQPGDRLIYFGAPWKVDNSRDAGWMAGFLDGEGYVGAKCVAVTQASGPTCEEAKRILKNLGFEFSVQVPKRVQPQHRPLETLKILGGRYESMRLLGQVRPVRLSRDRLWVDGSLVSKGPWVEVGSSWATVEAVEDLGDQANVTMSTTTRTFISDGFLSHNSLLKYDTASKGYRFGDVIDLVHPDPSAPWQGDLYRYALDRRHNRANGIPDSLVMVCRNALLRSEAEPSDWLNPDLLRQAGMTWEDALSAVGSKVDKAALWAALIPTMGYMALLRNLRNFDEAGVPDEVAGQVAARLADPGQVARSRQFPFRFYAAHNAVQSLRWGHTLEKALAASLANVPALSGRTLILIDQSPSMFPGGWWSYQATHRDIVNADLAKLFGSALALRAVDATLVGYGHANYPVPVGRGEAVLHLMGKFRQVDGTDAYTAARDHFRGHDRIVVVTDGENNGRLNSWDEAGVPRTTPIYTWNIGGYKASRDPGRPNRHVFAGLTDAAWRMVPLVESGRNCAWPWLQQA